MEVFPVSKLAPHGVLRVFALSFQEAPQLEEFHDSGVADWNEALRGAQELLHDDCAWQYETRWDVWQWDGEWRLKPAMVRIEVFGPAFESPDGEHVHIEFADESQFLPNPHSDQLRPVQSNLRSLLRLSQELEDALVVERHLLWSETEENFAERLEELLG
jgi:hypothetical protein